MEQCKKILMIAYHFPPSAEVGAIRPQKFAKFLPGLGWQPYVLTVDESFIPVHDKARLNDVKGAVIKRIPLRRTPLQVAIDLRNLLRSKCCAVTTEVDSGSEHTKANTLKSQVKGICYLKNLAIELNRFPDDKMYWIIPAVIAGYKIMRAENIKHIYVTAPPHSVSIVGYLLACLTGARLIVDFRDPWMSLAYQKDAIAKSDLTARLKFELERRVIHRADVVINVGERITNALRKSYPEEPFGKFVTIMNGLDSDDFVKSCVPAKDDGRFIISYLGEFYLKRTPEIFLKAISELITAGDIDFEDIEIRFIGNVSHFNGVPVENIVKKYSLNRCVKIMGTVPYKEAIRYMAESSALLLLAQQQQYGVPTKAYDYMAVNRPILALTEEGDIDDLFKLLGVGVVVNPGDSKQIANAVLQLYHDFKSKTGYMTQPPDISSLERSCLTKKLIDLFDV